MKVRVRMRGLEAGGAPDGTPEVDSGISMVWWSNFRIRRYCGGAGALGTCTSSSGIRRRRKGCSR